MAGIVQDAMPPQGAPQMPPQQGAPAPDQQQAGAPNPVQEITPQSVRAGMHMPPSLAPAYEKIVAAGMKVMFDPKTHGQMLQLMQEPGPLEQKLGTGIAGLMLLLYTQSNRTMPPQLIIPAGIELLLHAVDFLKKSGQDVPNEVVAEGIALMVQTLMQKFGLDPAKLQAKLQGGSNGSPPDMQQQPEPEGDEQAGMPDEAQGMPEEQGA